MLSIKALLTSRCLWAQDTMENISLIDHLVKLIIFEHLTHCFGFNTLLSLYSLLGFYTLLGAYTSLGFYKPLIVYKLLGFYTRLGIQVLCDCVN